MSIQRDAGLRSTAIRRVDADDSTFATFALVLSFALAMLGLFVTAHSWVNATDSFAFALGF